MYFVKTPWYLKTIYPSLIWDVENKSSVYLTFDDGPIPGVTDEVLGILDEFKAKATFFCIGNNVEKNKSLFEKIKLNGHQLGNHTFHHLNGWKTENQVYYDDVNLCDELVGSKYFRPPYGRIAYAQIQELKKRFMIVMWDVLSGDFDTEITAEQCIENVISNATPGSIIVFHDSEKAKPRVLKSLPVILKNLKEKGLEFGLI